MCFYALVFNLAILFTEDSANIKRLKIIGEHHFQYYKNGNTGPLKIDPLVTIYDTFESLPSLIKARIAPNRQGEQSYYFEDDLELNLFANQINTPAGITMVYAVERIDAIEIADLDTVLLEGTIFVVGLHISAVIAGFIFRTIHEITKPFTSLLRC